MCASTTNKLQALVSFCVISYYIQIKMSSLLSMTRLNADEIKVKLPEHISAIYTIVGLDFKQDINMNQNINKYHLSSSHKNKQ